MPQNFVGCDREQPSRLVQAIYAGAPVTDSADSGIVKAILPAKIRLRHCARTFPGVACW
jgi:hypothetical protein